MSLFDRVKKVAVGPPATAVVAPLTGEHVLVGTDDKGVALEPEQSYYRVWVSEMGLQHGRKWFTDWHPAVQMATSTTAGAAEEYAGFAGPVEIEGFSEAPGRAVKMEHDLTPLLPFRGGTVSLTAGLVAIKGDSVVKALVDTVAGFGTLLANPEVVAGAKVASKVVDGIETVLGLDADKLLVGFDRTYTTKGGNGAPNVFISGYVAVLDAPAGSIRPEHLWVDTGRLLHRPSQDPAVSPPVSFALLWIESRQTRDDWQSIASVSTPYLAAVSSFDPNQKRASYRQAITAVRTHPMLTEADRRAFALKLQAQAKDDGGLGATGDIPMAFSDFAETVTMPRREAVEAAAPLAQLLDF